MSSPQWIFDFEIVPFFGSFGPLEYRSTWGSWWVGIDSIVFVSSRALKCMSNCPLKVPRKKFTWRSRISGSRQIRIPDFGIEANQDPEFRDRGKSGSRISGSSFFLRKTSCPWESFWPILFSFSRALKCTQPFALKPSRKPWSDRVKNFLIEKICVKNFLIEKISSKNHTPMRILLTHPGQFFTSFQMHASVCSETLCLRSYSRLKVEPKFPFEKSILTTKIRPKITKNEF